MPEFNYEAMGATGQRNNGTLTANNEREVLGMLSSRGLFPLRVQMARESVVSARGSRGPRVSKSALATFYSQLADLLHSGVPLLRSLDILERQASSPKLALILREVRGRVADGTGLAQAMGQFPNCFDELSVSMIRAGQEGGFLEDVLRRIADFTEHQQDLKAKVTGAMAYPAFLAIVGVIVLNILVIFFVPRFEPIFKKLEEKDELPLITQVVIGLSRVMTSWTIIIPLGLGAAAVFGLYTYSRTDSGRIFFDTCRLRAPLAGGIFLQLALSRFTRILGTMLRNGIPILNALRIAKDSTGNKVLALAIDEAAENVKGGQSLAKPLAACPFMPRDIIEMIAVGEESNSLEKVLIDVAGTLEKRTTRQLELFVRLLEPIMLLIMAACVLFIVAGLLLPVFKMSETLG
jgi:general secretion pathway protein F/type IV pilus assembly protein PilC